MTQISTATAGHLIYRFLLTALICLYGASFLRAQPCPQGGITPEEYARRRVALISMMDSTSILVMRAPEANSEFEQMNYRQDPDFLYLTGVDAPGYTLLIVPGGLPVEGGR
ncbi:MAG: aminopeptidase P N-terminal domain-containing protein, partial [Bacteroidota bacterium]